MGSLNQIPKKEKLPGAAERGLYVILTNSLNAVEVDTARLPPFAPADKSSDTIQRSSLPAYCHAIQLDNSSCNL